MDPRRRLAAAVPGGRPVNPWRDGPSAALAACRPHLDQMYAAGWGVQTHGRSTDPCFWCQTQTDPSDLAVRDR